MTYTGIRKREPSKHIDDWLMTYADMITLLLCFFVLFLAATAFHQKASASPAPQVLAEAAPPPVAKPVAEKFDLPFPDALLLSPDDEKKTVEKTPEPPVPTEACQTSSAEPAPAPTPTQAPQQTLPQIVDQLKTQGPATLEQKGDRLTSLEMDSGAFFDRGSAQLKGEGKNVLLEVSRNLKADQYKDYTVTVEGHTDDNPINTEQFPSNWELSTARAAAVVHFFIDQGIPAQKLRASGYADSFPKAQNRDQAGNALPNNQAQNRRVVIKLEKVDKNP